MRATSLLLLCTLLVSVAFAQEKHSGNDSIFAYEQSRLGALLSSDPASGLPDVRKLVHLAALEGNSLPKYQKVGSAYTLLAAYLARLSKSDSAAYYQHKCLQIYRAEGDTLRMSSIYYNLGIAAMRKGYFYTTQEYLDSALSCYQKLGLDQKPVRAYALQMAVYNNASEYERTLALFKKAVPKLEAILQQELEAASRKNLMELKTGYWNAKGNAWSGLHREDSAFVAFERAFQIIEQHQLYSVKSQVGVNLCRSAMTLGKDQLAIQLLEEMLPQTDSNNHYLFFSLLAVKAEWLMNKGQSEEALRIMQYVVNQLNEEDLPDLYGDMYEVYTELLQRNRQFEMAIRYRNKADSVRLHSIDERKRLMGEELSRKYELKEKDMSISFLLEKEALQNQLIQESEQRNKLYLGIAILLAIALFLIFYVWRLTLERNRKNQELNRALQEALAFQNTLSAILSHDIRNYTSAIDVAPAIVKRLIEKDQRQAAYQILDDWNLKLHELHLSIHNLLMWSAAQLQPESDSNYPSFDPAQLIQEMFQSVQALADSSAVSLVLKEPIPHSVGIHKGAFEVVLRNAVFNALKHSKANALRIEIQELPTEIELQIIDNGVGLDDKTAESIALHSTQLAERWKNTRSGFGLWIMKFYCEKANASMRYSRKDGESVLNFRFPKKPAT